MSTKKKLVRRRGWPHDGSYPYKFSFEINEASLEAALTLVRRWQERGYDGTTAIVGFSELRPGKGARLGFHGHVVARAGKSDKNNWGSQKEPFDLPAKEHIAMCAAFRRRLVIRSAPSDDSDGE